MEVEGVLSILEIREGFVILKVVEIFNRYVCTFDHIVLEDGPLISASLAPGETVVVNLPM